MTQALRSSPAAQIQDADGFPPASQNAQNGRKVAPDGPGEDRRLIAPLSPQRMMQQEVGCSQPDDEQPWEEAELARLSDIPSSPAARKRASRKPAASPEDSFPQVAIPAPGEIEARRKMGRPTVIHEQIRCQIVTLLGAGASLTQTAAHLGVARSTIAAALERDEEFAQAVHEARQRASLFPLNCLLREATRDWRAAAWLLSYLERKSRQERTQRERVFEAADEEIERDVVQEMREQARQDRQAYREDEPDDSESAPPCAPEIRPARRCRESESSRSTKSGGRCDATDELSMTCDAESGPRAQRESESKSESKSESRRESRRAKARRLRRWHRQRRVGSG